MNYEALSRKVDPALTDQNLIAQIFNLHFAGSCKLSMLEKIAVILRLYDPDALEGLKAIDRGLWLRLSHEIETPPELLKIYLVSARTYMLIYRNFKDRVEAKAVEIAGYYLKR